MVKSALAGMALIISLSGDAKSRSEEEYLFSVQLSTQSGSGAIIPGKADALKLNSAKVSDGWTFKKINGTKLVFQNGQSFETGLYDLAYIGQISLDRKPPFLIYSGRDCYTCHANIALYFHSPRNGPLEVEAGKNRYNYPGKEFNYLNNSLIYEATTYYGEVLPDTWGVIWFQKNLQDDGTLKPSVFLASIKGDKIMLQELSAFDENLVETINLNKLKKNTKIVGRDFTSEP